ncbi:MAG TPA: Bcr/CflA family multidrug efflux MFS transporter [Dongiaceae bacterium]|jgi:DHA1 family bicyclomycin/chloramphenicol resistance-like MFS transporter|nr:Bcr/CflA family multidrug efflux MFS transporter [Dongiaceae bacterium]
MSEQKRARWRHTELVVILATLSVITPLGIDMYLPALPSMAKAFNATDSDAQFTLSTYFLGFAIGQAFYGPIADRFGRIPPLYFGMGLYCIASLGCVFAPSLEALAGLRFLQALGGCAGTVIARAMVRDLFTGAEAIRVFSRVLLVFGLGPILAPFIGGYMLYFFDWHGIFAVLTLAGIVALVVIFFRLEETRDPAHVRPLRIGSVVVGYWRLLVHRTFIGFVLCGATMMAGTFAYIAGSPFVVEDLYGLSSQAFPWVFGINALGFILASQVNVRAQRRHSPERVLFAALAFQLAAGIVLAFDGWTGTGGLWGILVPLFFWVSTMGFVIPNTTALAMAPFAANAGAASALLGVVQFVLAAASSGLVGQLEDGTARPMVGVMLLCSVLSLTIQRLAVRRRR